MPYIDLDTYMIIAYCIDDGPSLQYTLFWA